MKLKPIYWRQRFKDMQVSEGYGERRRKKEEERYPLLAMMGELETPEKIEAKQNKINEAHGERMRREQAKRWLHLRAWLRGTTEKNKEKFFRHWRCVPHEAHYGLDIAHSIDRLLLQETALIYGREWIYEASEDSRNIRPKVREQLKHEQLTLFCDAG